MEIATTIAGIEFVAKTLFFFLHEKIWERIENILDGGDPKMEIRNVKIKYPFVSYCRMCKYLKGRICTKKNIDVSKRGYLMFCDDFEPK